MRSTVLKRVQYLKRQRVSDSECQSLILRNKQWILSAVADSSKNRHALSDSMTSQVILYVSKIKKK